MLYSHLVHKNYLNTFKILTVCRCEKLQLIIFIYFYFMFACYSFIKAITKLLFAWTPSDPSKMKHKCHSTASRVQQTGCLSSWATDIKLNWTVLDIALIRKACWSMESQTPCCPDCSFLSEPPTHQIPCIIPEDSFIILFHLNAFLLFCCHIHHYCCILQFRWNLDTLMKHMSLGNTTK